MSVRGAGRLAVASALTAVGLCALTGTAFAQQPATNSAAAQPASNLVAPGAIGALKDMGAFLQTLKRFQVTTEVTGERVLADGQKLQHAATASLDVVRPNKLRVRMESPRSERELIFDGRIVTLYTPALKYYSTAEVVDTISGLIGRLQEGFGVEVPLSDLFLWGTPEAPLDQIRSAMNAGQDVVGDDLCDHYAFRQGNYDWQIWIKTGSKPLPRKIVISDQADESRPQSVSLIAWNLKPTFKDSIFAFTPPKGATKVEMVPVKTK